MKWKQLFVLAACAAFLASTPMFAHEDKPAKQKVTQVQKLDDTQRLKLKADTKAGRMEAGKMEHSKHHQQLEQEKFSTTSGEPAPKPKPKPEPTPPEPDPEPPTTGCEDGVDPDCDNDEDEDDDRDTDSPIDNNPAEVLGR